MLPAAEEKAFGIGPFILTAERARTRSRTSFGLSTRRQTRIRREERWTEKRVLLIDRYAVDDRGTFLNVWPFFEYRSAGEERTFFFPLFCLGGTRITIGS